MQVRYFLGKKLLCFGIKVSFTIIVEDFRGVSKISVRGLKVSNLLIYAAIFFAGMAVGRVLMMRMLSDPIWNGMEP
ncbi:hypothetical protein B9K05_03975 [Acetobacter syzygii]|uniref:Uncharacterized protein n=1 Tax=Acetobacter syzygii TaxID=146476 RepID=A0A270BQ21_9PROT|nr:hypothetical protein B9K05_03975 [Acetobacter syzygii]